MRTEFYKSLGIKSLNKRFKQAVMGGQLHIVEYFLTSNELSSNVDVHLENDFAFLVACKRGYLDMVCFLLTSEKLKERVNIHTREDLGLKKACEFGHLAVIEYLLFSPDLTDHANPWGNDKIFQVATKEAAMLLLPCKLEKELPVTSSVRKKHKI